MAKRRSIPVAPALAALVLANASHACGPFLLLKCPTSVRVGEVFVLDWETPDSYNSADLPPAWKVRAPGDMETCTSTDPEDCTDLPEGDALNGSNALFLLSRAVGTITFTLTVPWTSAGTACNGDGIASSECVVNVVAEDAPDTDDEGEETDVEETDGDDTDPRGSIDVAWTVNGSAANCPEGSLVRMLGYTDAHDWYESTELVPCSDGGNTMRTFPGAVYLSATLVDAGETFISSAEPEAETVQVRAGARTPVDLDFVCASCPGAD